MVLNAALKSRYVTDTVQTVSPARLVTMLYDGLVADLHTAEAAIGEADYFTANAKLLRAQAIVTELQASLDVSRWPEGQGLNSLYDFLHRSLVDANVNKDSAKVATCRRLIEPLQAAWHEAALAVASR